MPETWHTENASGKGVVPSTGLPQRTLELADTSALGIPRTPAKKRETLFVVLPVSFAPAVTWTVRLGLSRVINFTLLRPSTAFLLARSAAIGAVAEQLVSASLLAHLWATIRAAESEPFCSWARSE